MYISCALDLKEGRLQRDKQSRSRYTTSITPISRSNRIYQETFLGHIQPSRRPNRQAPQSYIGFKVEPCRSSLDRSNILLQGGSRLFFGPTKPRYTYPESGNVARNKPSELLISKRDVRPCWDTKVPSFSPPTTIQGLKDIRVCAQ